MNNLLSYCGFFDAKIRASDNDLPVNLDVKSKCALLDSVSNLSFFFQTIFLVAFANPF